MTNRERKQYEAMLKIKEFGQARAADFPAGSFGHETFSNLNRIIETLAQYAVDEDTHRTDRRQRQTAKSVQREALREDLRAMQRAARAMARRQPGIEEKFRVPARQSDREFITTARRFAADAEPLTAEFIKYELPTDFLDDLRADITALEQTLGEKTVSASSAVTVGAAIDENIAAGIEAIRDLDAVVRNRYRNDPTTLAAWANATHVARPPRVAKAKEAAA